MASMTSELIVRLRDMVSAPARAIANNMARLRQAQKLNSKQMDVMRGRMLDATAAAYLAARAISAPTKAAMEFESTMADVRKVVDFKSPDAFKKMGKDIIDMSMRLPMAANDIGAIVAAAGQAGMKGGELLQFAEMATKIGVAFDMTADQTGTSLAKMKTALRLTVPETQAVADVINHLSNNMASTAPELIDYMARVGSQGELFGFSVEQTAALGSAMIATGAEANIAATSLRAVGRALTRGANATKAQRKAFKLLGLDSAKVSKAMQKDAAGTLREVIARIGQLPEHMRATTLSEIFGDEARAIAPLITNIELYDEALANVADKTKYLGSTQKEYDERAKSTEHNLQLLRNKADAAAIAFGSALLPAINSSADAIGPMLIAMAHFADEHPQVVQALVAITGALIGARVASIALKWSFLFLKGGALDAAIGLGRLLVGLRAIKGAATGMIGLQTSLAAMEGIKLTRFGAVVAGLRGMALAVPGMSALGTAITAVGTAIAGMGAVAIGAIVAYAAMVATAWISVWKHWDRISSIFSGVAKRVREELQPVFERLQPVLDAIAPVVEIIGNAFAAAGEKIGQFVGWLGSLFEREVLSDEQKAGFEQAGYDVADSMINAIKEKIGQMVEWFKTLPQRIVTAIGSINLGDIIKWPELPGFLGGGNKTALPAIEAAHASGGVVRRGATYLVGEQGPELFTSDASGYVHSNSDSKAMMRSGGSAGSAKGASAGGQSNFYFGDIILPAAQNAEEIARDLGQILREKLAGIHSDTEWSAG